MTRRLAGMFAATVFALLALVGCGPGYSAGKPCEDSICAESYFHAYTAVVVTPSTVDSAPGQTATIEVTVVNLAYYRVTSHVYFYDFKSLQRVEPDEPGVRTETVLIDSSRPCVVGEVPDGILIPGGSSSNYVCTHLRLNVTTPSSMVGFVTGNLKATFDINDYDPRVGEPNAPPVEVSQSGQFAVRLVAPDFALGVVPVGKVYATSGFVQVKVDRRFGFAEPVQLSLDGFASGITGVFTPNPVPPGVDSAQLRLQVPAIHGGGTFTQLKVLGTGGGLDRSWQFGQLVEPLYTVKLATADGSPAVLTPLRPLDLEVTIAFDPYGPFSVTGPGRIDLSLPDPPPDVVVEFLPDAQPSYSTSISVFPAAPVLRRTLRLTGPRIATMDDLRVRATAVSLLPDMAMQQPYAEGNLALRLDPSQSWDYVESGATNFLSDNDAIGIGMQNNNQPAIAWLEGPQGGSKAVYLKRSDGAIFAPSPSASGLYVSGGWIEQARMAMAGNDVAHVAITYKVDPQDGARVALASAGAAWSVHDEVSSLPPAQHARSPRIATGLNDSLALSYLVETGIPAGAGSLFVRGRLATGALAALPGPRLDLSINVNDSGQVLRDTPSLALRIDGNPWLAWLEAPFDPVTTLPPALWLRGHDGTRWSEPIAVPRTRPLVAAPTQLLVTQTGKLIVAWLEASPARLMLAIVDPLTGVATELRDPANPDGALNTTSSEPARDASLTIDSSGRLVVTWTEGLTRPALYAKRLNSGGTWARLGTAIDDSHPTRSPFVTSDGFGKLYVVWTGFFLSTDLDSPLPKTDVLVGRWIFP